MFVLLDNLGLTLPVRQNAHRRIVLRSLALRCPGRLVVRALSMSTLSRTFPWSQEAQGSSDEEDELTDALGVLELEELGLTKLQADTAPAFACAFARNSLACFSQDTCVFARNSLACFRQDASVFARNSLA
eukprot:105656-Pleurochrysis_carterae.AAC.1